MKNLLFQNKKIFGIFLTALILSASFLYPKQTHASPVIVGHTLAQSTNGFNATTVGINTTGATLFVATVCAQGGAMPTVSDSKGNIWQVSTTQTDFPQAAIFYAYAPITDPAQTFTISSAGLNPSIAVLAVSGTLTNSSVFDGESGHSTDANAGTIQPGSITPAQSGDLFISNLCTQNSSIATFTIDSGFVKQDSVINNGSALGIASGYFINPGSGSENPTWTVDNGSNWLSAKMAAFKSAAGGGPTPTPTPTPTGTPTPTATPTPTPTPTATPTPSGSNFYVAQNSVGSGNGTSCTNAFALSFLTTYANWGNTAGHIGPGTTVHLCGTITTQFPISNSGTNGNPIIIKWEPGAKLSVPYCISSGGPNPSGCIDFQGNSYIILDGGSPCGPGTACSINDSGTGIIEATANGSSLTNKQDGAGLTISGGVGIEVKNLIIRNMYQHTTFSDSTGGRDTSAIKTSGSGCSNCSFHDLTIHDSFVGYNGIGSADSNVNIYNTYFYDTNWGIYRGTSLGNTQTNLAMHDNHFGSVSNWDDAADANHHDRLFLADGVAGQGNYNGVYIYNNLFDGTSGCCSTAMIYFGGGTEQNTYVYNNLFNDSLGTTSMNALLEETGGPLDTLWTYSNTFIGAPGLVEAVCVQLEGTVVFENNAVTGCSTLVMLKSNSSFTSIDYNTYGNADTRYIWQSNGGSTNYTTLSGWRAFTAGETHSTYNSTINLGPTGIPQAGSPALAAGANLLSIANASLAALANDASLGNTRTSISRPTSGPWDVGAYQVSSGGGTGTPIPGDLNLDHIVNALDYSIMNAHWLQNFAQADINSDGLVNSIDFAVLKSNWGKTW